MEAVNNDVLQAEAEGGPVETTNDLWSFFYKCFENNLDQIAVISHHQAVDHLAWLVPSTSTNTKASCLSWTYRQLLSAADRVVHAFQASEVPSGKGLVIFIWNSVEYHIFFLAAIKLRMQFVPLDPRILTRTTELEATLTPVNPGAIVVTDEEAAAQLEKSSPSTRSNCKVKVILEVPASQQPPSNWSSFSTLAHTDPSSSSQSVREAGSELDIVAILFTSGTTNRPKGTPHSVQNCVAESYAYIARVVKTTSRILMQTSCFRAIFYAWTICAWRQAACLVLAGKSFSPLTTLEAMSMHKITNVTLIPSVYTAMIEHARFEELKPHTLEYVGFAGDVSMPSILLKAKSKLQAKIVRSSLGMTECTGVVGWEGDISDKNIPTYHGFVAVGAAGPGNKIRICEPGGRKVLNRGEIGELHLGGQAVIREYLEGRFAEIFYDERGERWFKTGDRVLMDEKGLIYVLGRYKDIIKRSGLAISPTVVEGHLNNEIGIKVNILISFSVSHLADKLAGSGSRHDTQRTWGSTCCNCQENITRRP